jgi:hypothetical protein
MDLTEAATAHMRWKIRLLQCIHGQAELPNSDEVARADACDLGKWLGHAPLEYSSLAGFSDAKSNHAAFHLRAAEVVAAVEKAEMERAEAMLGADTPYTVASDAVVLALTTLRAEARKAGKNL